MTRNFNIKPENARYIIDEKNKVVVCIIDRTRRLFIDFAISNFSQTWIDSKLFSRLEMPNRFSGIARCSADDTWNVDTGKLIAFSRAKDKVNQSFFKRANIFIDTHDKWLNDAVDLLNRVGDRLSINTDHRHNLIESLIGSEEVSGDENA